MILEHYAEIDSNQFTTPAGAVQYSTVLKKYKKICVYQLFYNSQINARALIGQSAVVYCAGKPTEKSRVF